MLFDNYTNFYLEEFIEEFDRYEKDFVRNNKQLFRNALGWNDVIERKPVCGAQVLVRHLVSGNAYYAVAYYDIVGNTNKFTTQEIILNVTHWRYIMHLD